jgi:hypothetical protein
MMQRFAVVQVAMLILDCTPADAAAVLDLPHDAGSQVSRTVLGWAHENHRSDDVRAAPICRT